MKENHESQQAAAIYSNIYKRKYGALEKYLNNLNLNSYSSDLEL
jgi:hypothetical protein